MVIHLDNPAGRLHSLLSEIRAKPSSQNAPQAWGEVLGAANDWAELLRLYALVVGLPKEILDQIATIDPSLFPADLAIRWRKPVIEALSVDFSRGVKVEHVTHCFDGEVLAYLEICGDVLHRYRRGIYVPDPDLEHIKNKVGELLADVEADPDIDPEVRDFLLRHGRAMARALPEVPIRGAAGI